MKKLFLLFNHKFTASQEQSAYTTLQVDEIITPPRDLSKLWSDFPSDVENLKPILQPIFDWLQTQADNGDYILIHGDFGATYLMVQFAVNYGLIPIYSTTRRIAEEQLLEDGTVNLTHRFNHVIFRKYGR